MAETIILHSTSLEDFKSIIGQIVRDELKNLPIPPSSNTKDYLKSKEVCEVLGVSNVTLIKLRNMGIIKGYRLNSRIRYKRSEIESSLQQIKSIKYRRVQ